MSNSVTFDVRLTGTEDQKIPVKSLNEDTVCYAVYKFRRFVAESIGLFEFAGVTFENVVNPTCPFCKEEMTKAYEQDEEGAWGVRWLCGCEVSLEKSKELSDISRSMIGG